MADAAPLLEVQNLCVEFDGQRSLRSRLAREPAEAVLAVNDVSFTIAAGSFVALVGASGSGKTTCGMAALGMVAASRGHVIYRGTALDVMDKQARHALRARTQMVWQDPYGCLDPRFRVRQTIEEPLRIHRPEMPANERTAIVDATLTAVGLTPAHLFTQRRPHELSGGQRQRVVIAAALALEPEFIVADEPASMLDAALRIGILDLFADLQEKGIAIMMMTHDLNAARRYAEHIVVVDHGVAVEQGPTETVLQAPEHEVTRRLLAAVPTLSDVAADPKSAVTS
jgi:peptide/nickel transport system ATP-binding protein